MDPCIFWFTGLSGSGKSTISEALFKRLKKEEINAEYLDGDSIRAILPETGFTRSERDRHIRSIGMLASILERNGIIVVASFVSPFRDSRDFVRKISRRFIEIYVSTPLEVCEHRDVKGLYARARRGEIENFTGVSSPYEPPLDAELNLDTTKLSVQESVNQIIKVWRG